jgi:hypothetical protein
MIVKDPNAKRYTKRDWRENSSPLSKERRLIRVEHKKQKRVAKKMLEFAAQTRRDHERIYSGMFHVAAAQFIMLTNNSKFQIENDIYGNGTYDEDVMYHDDAWNEVVSAIMYRNYKSSWNEANVNATFLNSLQGWDNLVGKLNECAELSGLLEDCQTVATEDAWTSDHWPLRHFHIWDSADDETRSAMALIVFQVIIILRSWNVDTRKLGFLTRQEW